MGRKWTERRIYNIGKKERKRKKGKRRGTNRKEERI